jgi:hypothetical protein
MLSIPIIVSNAQTPTFDWITEAVSTNATSHVKSIDRDDAGNIYIAGHFGDVLQLGDTTFTAYEAPNTDIFLAKLDPQGNFIWSRQFGFASTEYCNDMTIGPDGNLYITGQYSDSLRFDQFLLYTPDAWSSLYVAKFDTSGQVLWAEHSSGFGFSHIHNKGNSVAVDAQGNCYVGGSFSSDSLFIDDLVITRSVGPEGEGVSNGIVVKFDPTGEAVWAAWDEIGTNPGFNEVTRLTLDDQDNIYAGGIFGGLQLVLGGDTLATQNMEDGFFGKIDPSGNYLWTHAITGFSLFQFTYETITGLAWSPTGLYVAGGYMGESVTLGNLTIPHPNLNEFDMVNLFLFKLDEDGTILWGKAYGEADCQEYINNISFTPEATVLISGGHMKTFQMDGNTLPNGTSCVWLDGFLAEIDPDGNPQWVKTGGGNDQHDWFSDALMIGDSIYACGFTTSSPAHFDALTLNSNDIYPNTFVTLLQMPSTTSIGTVATIQTTLLHPIPARDVVHIHVEGKILKCEAFDGLGQAVVLQMSGPNQLNVEQLTGSVYLLRITTDEGVFYSRLIKE